VCALGKFGGRELGFASDFEVMFVYDGSGRTRGGTHAIDLPELCERLAETTCAAITALQEGIFEVDLRLRPYGDSGPLAVSRRAFAEYFGERGDAWWYERQALIKLRPVAGAMDVGRRIAALRDGIVYGGRPPDVAASRAMRERQLRHLVTPGTVNAKYSAGGLVDLEYLVQLLQLRHGHRHESLRVTNTLEALRRMGELGLIGEDDLDDAVDAYRILRRLIDALRMVRGHARDLSVPTTDDDELAFLARRLGDRTVGALRRDLDLHLGRVRDLCERLL
jgi:glutamate-ammonia-ligase adenylyltransferase